jgi:hypothetical protein
LKDKTGQEKEIASHSRNAKRIPEKDELLAFPKSHPRTKKSSGDTSMRELWRKDWQLEIKSQWLEKLVKKAENKVNQIMATVDSVKDTAYPGVVTVAVKPEKKRKLSCQAVPELLKK